MSPRAAESSTWPAGSQLRLWLSRCQRPGAFHCGMCKKKWHHVQSQRPTHRERIFKSNCPLRLDSDARKRASVSAGCGAAKRTACKAGEAPERSAPERHIPRGVELLMETASKLLSDRSAHCSSRSNSAGTPAQTISGGDTPAAGDAS